MTPLLILLVVLALLLLYKTTSPYVAMDPPDLYAWAPGARRAIPIDPPVPGIDWRLHPSIAFKGTS
jgi:hypothetical protein